MKFNDIVGQEAAKRKLDFWLDSFKATAIMPHMMFVAPRGIGKTALAEATGVEMKDHFRTLKGQGSEKRMFTINCATIKNLRQFWDGIAMPILNDRDCTILFDEASELPLQVTMALLTMINPNANNRNEFTYDGYRLEVDFRRQSFMFATTEAQKIFHALKDRCSRIDLVDYTCDELSRIMQLNAPEVKFESDELRIDVASTLRSNARQATMMSKEIERFLAMKNRKTFTAKDWKTLKYALNILPLGLAPLELRALEILNSQKDVSLNRLSAGLGMSKESVMRDIEVYLQRLAFFEVTTGGRNITAKGQAYLKELQKEIDSR